VLPPPHHYLIMTELCYKLWRHHTSACQGKCPGRNTSALAVKSGLALPLVTSDALLLVVKTSSVRHVECSDYLDNSLDLRSDLIRFQRLLFHSGTIFENILIVLYCIDTYIYSSFCSAHQSEALPVRETQREESSLERTKRGTWLTS